MTDIETGLSGPSKACRLTTLGSLLESKIIDSEIVQTLISIENVPSNIQEYRDRERHLENLIKFFQENSPSVQSEKAHVICFRHLLGSLYVNFEKFWGPTIRVIISLVGQSRYSPVLIRTLQDHLTETNDLIYDHEKGNHPSLLEDRPDHVLHRNFIFQIMAKFAHQVELSSEIFMDQFFRFSQEELHVSPFIEKCTRENLTPSQQGADDQANCDKNSKLHDKRPEQSSKMQKQKSKETFITVSKVIHSFRDVDKIHRRDELRKLVLELLCCRDSSIQKAALNCLLIFKLDALEPYVPKLFKLLDDKSVRTELTTFSADQDSHNIQDEHRAELMPILLRILFGKMIGKIGKKGTGRDKSDLRKTLVMRFIATCLHEEIVFFFGLLFDPIFCYTEIEYNQLAGKLDGLIDLTQYVPVNKLHAMLGSIQSYMESVAHLREESLGHVFKLINVITYHVVTPLENSNLSVKLSDKSVKSLKAIRRECMNTVAEFFRVFEYYSYSQDELDFVFGNLIWPNTCGFVDRNYAYPTPLLRLIEVFATHQTYHVLLVKRNKANQDQYLLTHLVDLYTADKTNRPVVKLVASIFARILKPEVEEEEEDGEGQNDETIQADQLERPVLLDRDAKVPTYDLNLYKIDRELSFGETILISSIPAIFEKLQKSIRAAADKRNSDAVIEKDELKVLSALSEFLKNSEQSLLGVRLLLSTLSSQKKAELILGTLSTAQTLLRQVTEFNDPTIIPSIAEILGYQRNTLQRSELCDLVGVISQINPTLETVHQILLLLNAVDGDMVDLVKWNAGFQSAFNYLDQQDESSINKREVIKDSFTLLLHQVGFIMNNIDRYDYSIRENSVIFYEKLAQKLFLIKEDDLLHYFIDEVLLEKFFKKGLRDTNDTIKHTYINALRPIIIHCHEKNRILGEFYMFCNENHDLDFWINIRSIQMHNRSKALARLIGNENLHRVSPRTLSSYFMPLASAFLFSRAYKSVSSLTENSIKLIGLICRHLNWVTYESTLSYYLDQLTNANATYQRTNIKLITEIIKNFNFDITACEEAMQHEEESAKLEKRMRKRLGPGESRDVQEVITADAPSGRKLNKSTAKMVYMSVTKRLIPRLESCLHEMTSVEFQHDKKMADYLPEKDEIKRIPLAFAIIQLLNVLPGRYVLLRDHLPALFLKLSSFLKSKNEQVRRASRSTLIRIMAFIGPAYMSDLLRILKQNLEKGFQIHVLNYTIHSILDKLPLRYGDLDQSAHELIISCFQEIFGDRSEDKEILQILAKTYEAKKTKSYDTLMILATYISADKLDSLMNAIRDTSKTCNEPSKVNKLSQCIQKVFTGLSKNEKFPLDRLLTFVQATIEESIPHLKLRQRIQLAAVTHENSGAEAPRREDRYLIHKDLPRDRVKSKINEKGNFHMVVENSLRLLLHTFEKNKIIIKRKEIHKRKLDGFIALLSKCLKSSSPKCVMRALKCIYFIAKTKIELPTFKVKCNSIVKKLFVLLSLYNGVGMVRGDNLEMIGMCFKTITLLLLRCDRVQLSQDQVRALLTYIEQDLHDTTRQGTAFATLHSLLQRRCESPELPDIMAKLTDLLVTTEDETVRTLTIKIWQTYLLDYKHEGSSLQNHLMKFMRQLDYEYIDGRKSVIRMLTVVISKFPENLLREYFELMFHLLSQRIANEESKEVRALVGRLIALLVQRLPHQQDYLINKFVLPWAAVDSCDIKMLGIKLLSVFCEANPNLFRSNKGRMKKTLELIFDALEKSSSESPKEIETSLDDVDSAENTLPADTRLVSVNEKLIYSSLRLFKRLLDKKLINCIETRYIESLKKIWNNISSLQLINWHTPIVITSCELYLFFISETNLQDALNVESPRTDHYLEWNAKRIVRTLCDKFLVLLDRANEDSHIIEHVLGSMVLMGQMMCNCKATLDFESQYVDSFEDRDVLKHLLSLEDLPTDGFIHDNMPYTLAESKKRLDLVWLTVKVVMQARKEAAIHRLSAHHRREFVLKWTAAIAQELGPKRISPYVALLMMTPVRELTDKGKDKLNESSRQNITGMAEDLLKFLKSLIGLSMFNKMYSKVQLHYTKRRVDRKKREALSKVKGTKRNNKHDSKAQKKRRRVK